MDIGLCYDTNLLMKDLSVKRICDITPGEMLYEYEGNVLKVKENQELFEEGITIVPDDRGEQYTLTRNSKIYVRNLDTNNIEVKSLSELICNRDISNGLSVYNYKLLRCRVDMPHKKVDLEPYFAGLYLGDIKSQNQSDKKWNDVQNLYKYKVNVGYKEPNINDYVYNDRETRLNFLAGLVDSAATFEPNSHSFELTYLIAPKEDFVNSLLFLIRSLGLGSGKRDLYRYDGNKIIRFTRIYIYGDLKCIPSRLIKTKNECANNYQEINFTLYPGKMGRYYKVVLENGVDKKAISGGLDILII